MIQMADLLLAAQQMDDAAARQPGDPVASLDQDVAWWAERGYKAEDVYLYCTNLACAVAGHYELEQPQVVGMTMGIVAGLRLGVQLEREHDAVD